MPLNTKMKSKSPALSEIIDGIKTLNVTGEEKVEDAKDVEAKVTEEKEVTFTKAHVESDEDNENAEASDSDSGDNSEDYQERGPCKGGKSNHQSNRFNPMHNEKLHSNVKRSYVTEWSNGFSAPLSPPYSHSFTGNQEEVLFNDPSPPHDPYQQWSMGSVSPLYDSPVHEQQSNGYPSGYGASFSNANMSYPHSNGGLYNISPPHSNVTDSPAHSYVMDSPHSNPADSPLSLTDDREELCALEAVTQQLRGGLLSSNYLDALEDAVAKTVGDEVTSYPFSSSEEEDNTSCSSNSSVQHIVDSLRGIDPTELDYIAPASPGRNDLEEELALSEGNYDQLQVTPPLSPLSPSMEVPLIASPHSSHTKGAKGVIGKKAVSAIKKLCSDEVVLHAIKRVACQPSEDLCRKDPDGDTCFMIVVCKPAESNNFYENLFVLQQHLMKIRICCDQVMRPSSHLCIDCGSDETMWRSPLSLKNCVGDSVITCAAKMLHPQCVMNYLLTGIASNPNDVETVFDAESKLFLAPYVREYPALAKEANQERKEKPIKSGKSGKE